METPICVRVHEVRPLMSSPFVIKEDLCFDFLIFILEGKNKGK